MQLGPADAEFDGRFIDAMIPHHQAAEMAKEVQQNQNAPKLRLAADIIQVRQRN